MKDGAQRPQQGCDRTPSEPTQRENHWRYYLEAQRRVQTKGHRFWPQWGYGQTPSGSVQAQTSRATSQHLSLVGLGGDGGKLNAKGGLLLPFEGILGIFQGIHPSSPPIKGGPLPSLLINHQHKGDTMQQEERRAPFISQLSSQLQFRE